MRMEFYVLSSEILLSEKWLGDRKTHENKWNDEKNQIATVAAAVAVAAPYKWQQQQYQMKWWNGRFKQTYLQYAIAKVKQKN